MLIWGFVFAGVAFGVLIACLIVAERELKEKNQRLSLLESESAQSSGLGAERREGEENDGRSERKVAALQEEKSRLLAQLVDLEKQHSEEQEKVQLLEEAQTRIPELEETITQLKEENSQLLARLANLEIEQNGHQEQAELLEGLEKQFPKLEKKIAELAEEKSSLVTEVADLKKERRENQAKIGLLEDLQARVPAMERHIADLDRERSELQTEIADVKSLVLEKLESQLAGLNDLYRHLESGKS